MFTYGVSESRERDPRGNRSCVRIFLQNEYAGYNDSDAHHHDTVDSCKRDKSNIIYIIIVHPMM